MTREGKKIRSLIRSEIAMAKVNGCRYIYLIGKIRNSRKREAILTLKGTIIRVHIQQDTPHLAFQNMYFSPPWRDKICEKLWTKSLMYGTFSRTGGLNGGIQSTIHSGSCGHYMAAVATMWQQWPLWPPPRAAIAARWRSSQV